MMSAMAQVLVREESMSGRELATWVLPDLPESITARELVRLRVREEVARANVSGAALSWERQADAACEAFYRNAFVLLAGQRQIDSLDEVIDLTVEHTVSFIKLVPLVGG